MTPNIADSTKKSQQEKPREFWIYDINTRGEDGFTKRVITDKPKEHMGKDSSFIWYHVIEKSAFDSLKEELELSKAANISLAEDMQDLAIKSTKTVAEAMAKLNEVRAENARLKVLLERADDLIDHATSGAMSNFDAQDWRQEYELELKALAGGQDVSKD